MRISVVAAAAEAPDRPALIVDERCYTYGELAERVGRILPELGRRTAEAPRAALLGETDLATLVTLYALIELGRPVVLLHPRWSRRERERMLEAGAPLTHLDAPLRESPLSPQGERVGVRYIPDETCLAVVPTSGSSGRPKGVVLSRGAFLASAAASAANLGWIDDDRWLLSLPIAHVGGLSILTRCLAARRTVVVHRAERFDARDVIGVVQHHRVTLISIVPTMLRRLLAQEPRWDPPPFLRAVLVGGAATAPSLLEAAAERGWPVLTTYGMTEACSQVATQPYGTRQRGEMGCGPPLPGTEIRIVDGVVEVRGPQLLSGYLPSTGEAALSGDGWYRTDDLGHLDREGRLHVVGRQDDVIVTGGENVLVSEVEQALEEEPSIEAACVFGLDDDEWGQRVAAALVAAAEPLPDDELRRRLRPRLAAFKIPRRIVYVDELPRLPSGKIDRRAVAKSPQTPLS